MRKFLFKLLTPMVLATMVVGNLFVNAEALEEKAIPQEVEEFLTQVDNVRPDVNLFENNNGDLEEIENQVLSNYGVVAKFSENIATIAAMDVKNLSAEDVTLIYDTIEEYLSSMYSDIVSQERIASISEHVIIASTEECKVAYERASKTKYGDRILGFYIRNTDTTYIDLDRQKSMSCLFGTALHEALHHISNGGVKEEFTFNNVEQKAININEGITQYFAEIGMRNLVFEYTTVCYPRQVSVVKELENIFGADIIKEAYLKHNPEILRNAFETAIQKWVGMQGNSLNINVEMAYYNFLSDLNDYSAADYGSDEMKKLGEKVYTWISMLKETL